MLSYSVYGENNKQQILICHGLFGRKNNFNSIAKELEKDYQVFTVDMLGHGESPRSKSLTYNDFSNSLKDFISEKMHTPIYIMGHSMGGKSVMNLTLSNPELVEKIIVLDVAPKFYGQHLTYTQSIAKSIYELEMNQIKLNQIKSRKQVLEIFLKNDMSKNDALFILQSLQRDKDNKFYWSLDSEAVINNQKNINDWIHLDDWKLPLDKPSLFLRGENSDFILDEDIDLIKNYFINPKVLKITNSGHNVHIDNQKESLEYIFNFLKT